MSIDSIFVLKIELADSNPVISRRFAVPGKITLDRLHDVIQIVMGWSDSHLYEFTIGSKRFMEWPEKGDGTKSSGKTHLRDVAKKRGRVFQYLYDFGDSWEYEYLKSWYSSMPGGRSFFSKEYFDINHTNDELAKYQLWSRDRPIFWNGIS